jgi:hypothetical protein
MSSTHWIAAPSKGISPNPSEPGEIEASMWRNKLQYFEFTNRRICALVHGKSRHGEKAANTLFGSLVSPSQEVFTMFLYKNGLQKWVWMYNGSVNEASDGDTSDGSPR